MRATLLPSALKVPYVNLSSQHSSLREELLGSMERVLAHGKFILGPEVEAFEAAFADLCGVRFAIGVASGTDAIILTLRALGIGAGDEVITVPNSFIATTSAIVLAGAIPVFVDVREDFTMDPALLERAITSRTRAILPVHLTGHPADTDAILAIARAHNLPVIEDASQAVGAHLKGKPVGSIGLAACFSLHPLKVLSACGDAGVITTNDPELHSVLTKARNHGLKNRDECDFWSLNSRLDTLQAALLLVKLRYLPEWITKRRAIASFYRGHLADVVTVPQEDGHITSAYHTFVIQTEHRDALKAFLAERGIETAIHYPVPIHLQNAAKHLGYKSGDFPMAEKQAERILSLPIYPELTEEQQMHVIGCIREFFGVSQ